MPKGKIEKNFPAAQDILYSNQAYWIKINQIIGNLADAYGFDRLDLPIVERDDVFFKKIKYYSDISEREMRISENGKSDKFRLRSDFTASIIRAYLESGLSFLPKPVRLHAAGPVFYNTGEKKEWMYQSDNASFEIVGEKDSVIDAQLIQLFFSISRDAGLKNLIAKINSVGCSDCRPNYKKLLVNFYKNREKDLCLKCRKQRLNNPINLLNCENPKCVELALEAPQIIDCLCNECHNHLKNILEYLDEVEIPYMLDPYLFKNSDYCTKTVFEMFSDAKQDNLQALAIGHRHDDLIGAFGGVDTPAIGIDIRLSKMVDLMSQNCVKISQKIRPLVFLVQLGCLGKKKSLILFEELRMAGLRVANSVSCNTITSQLNAANRLGADFILILGQKEATDNTIIIRDVCSGIQELMPLEKIVKEIKKRIKRK
ncbi:histidine--tRNA ligase [Patescibacteria group bacterium]